MTSLQDRTLVIIGGSSGIGLRTGEMAAAEGAHLIIAGRHEERLADAATRLQEAGAASVATRLVDAHDHDQLEAFFATLPEFDHLVSMIGDVMGGGFLTAPMSEIRRVMESKFFTNVRIAQLAASGIRTGGSLVFTAGVGRPQGACAPAVGNMAVNLLVESLAIELAPRARANSVCPTWTLTTFWRDVAQEQVDQIKAHFEDIIPLQRLADIDDLAMTYLYLMKNGFITGQHIAVDGGVMLSD